tara:strand:- start:7575 stop:8084 length:510 start_codon:yes stop_codon:yes gene_type:complete
MKSIPCLPYVVDRGLCRFLTTMDFMSLRRTSKKHYSDNEAYLIFSRWMPVHITELTPREKIGLHYLLGWSLQLDGDIDKIEWVQNIVDWLTFPISIKIMFNFFNKNCTFFLMNIDLSNVNACQRFIWLKLCHKKSRVFKRKLLENKYNECGRKRLRHKIQVYRNLQPCC